MKQLITPKRIDDALAALADACCAVSELTYERSSLGSEADAIWRELHGLYSRLAMLAENAD